MKKIFKKLLITTALVTPIAISTPLLLTSCSADVEMTVETPPIFDVNPGNLIQSITDESSKKFFVFDITNNDFAEKLENETFNKIWNLTPGPKFDAQVTAIGDVINSSITETSKKIKFTANSTETNANEATYDSNVLETQEQFNAVKALFSNSRMTNIIETKTNGNKATPLTQGASFITDSFLKWDKFTELKNNIESKLQISVGKGTEIANKPLTTHTRISLTLTPKNNYVWPGLSTSDPIVMDLEFEQNEKAALFNNGFANAEPKFDSTANAFVFKATLNKNVFGAENLSKVTGTKDIVKWLKDGGFNSTASGGSTSQAVGSADIDGVSKRIKTIFDNLSDIKTTLKDQTNETAFNATLITSYIKGANITTEAPSSPQYFATTQTHAIGEENIKLKASSTDKKNKNDNNNKEYVITLVFGLADPTRQEWFGITDSANKNKDIKFDLTVNLA